MSKTLKYCFNFLIFLGLTSIVVFALIKYIKNSCISFYSATWVSSTIQEAKNKKVLIRKAEVHPKVLLINGRKVFIKECWIEKRTKIHYQFLFFKTRKFLGEYRLCFLINDSQNIFNRVSILIDGEKYYHFEGFKANYDINFFGSKYVKRKKDNSTMHIYMVYTKELLPSKVNVALINREKERLADMIISME